MSDGILCLSTFQTVSQFSFWKNPKRKCIVRLFLSNSILTGLNKSAINKTNKTQLKTLFLSSKSAESMTAIPALPFRYILPQVDIYPLVLWI